MGLWVGKRHVGGVGTSRCQQQVQPMLVRVGSRRERKEGRAAWKPYVPSVRSIEALMASTMASNARSVSSSL